MYHPSISHIVLTTEQVSGLVLRPLIFALTTATGNRLLLELRQFYATPRSPLFMDDAPLGPSYLDVSEDSIVHPRSFPRPLDWIIISITQSLSTVGTRLLFAWRDAFNPPKKLAPPGLEVEVRISTVKHCDTSPTTPTSPNPPNSMMVKVKHSLSQLRLASPSPTHCAASSPTSRHGDSLGLTLSVPQSLHSEEIYKMA